MAGGGDRQKQEDYLRCDKQDVDGIPVEPHEGTLAEKDVPESLREDQGNLQRRDIVRPEGELRLLSGQCEGYQKGRLPPLAVRFHFNEQHDERIPVST